MADNSINKWVREEMESGRDDRQRRNFVDYGEDKCSPDCPECKEQEDED